MSPSGGDAVCRNHEVRLVDGDNRIPARRGAETEPPRPDIHRLISLFTNDTDLDPEEIVDIYRKRWETGLLFKQTRQNFTLKYFYGESANAIKIQIWVTLIANLLPMVMQKGLKRQWSFFGIATMMRITLMYCVDFYSLFNNLEKDWEMSLPRPPKCLRN